MGLHDSGEESEKENERIKAEEKAKRKLYQKKLENVARINPRFKLPKKNPPAPSKKLTPEQKEDIKNIKLDEISAKWICPFKGKKKPVGGDGGQNGDSGEGGETSVGENVETEDGERKTSEGLGENEDAVGGDGAVTGGSDETDAANKEYGRRNIYEII